MAGTLFEKGKLGKDTPEQLINTLMFKIAKYFGLRGGSEIRDIQYSNLIITALPEGKVKILFCENQSKTNAHGLQGSSHNPFRGPHIERTDSQLSLFQPIFEQTTQNSRS